MFLGLHVKKFNLVINDHGHTQKCDLLILDGNILFGQIWSKKSKLLVWAEIWYLEKFQYAEFSGDVVIFCFRRKYPFWINLIQNFKTVWLKWNLVTVLIPTCRNQWWCSLSLFSAGNILFAKLVQKIKIVSLN